MTIIADRKEYDKVVAKIKARVSRWPSAYASGMVVAEYKRIMREKGAPAYLEARAPASAPRPLRRWFLEKWIDIKTGKECGAVHNAFYYPTCRPSIQINSRTPVIASALAKKDKEKMIKENQKSQTKTIPSKFWNWNWKP
jgi:hypothetical protein